jgi:hypothetical protein
MNYFRKMGSANRVRVRHQFRHRFVNHLIKIMLKNFRKNKTATTPIIRFTIPCLEER